MTLIHNKDRQSLGDVLVATGRISQQDLDQAIEIQRKENRRLTEVLVGHGVVTAEDVTTALSLTLNLPIIDLKRHNVQESAVSLIQERTAREHNVIPLDVIAGSLMVVMEDPANIGAIDELAAQANLRIQPAVGFPSQIREAIDIYYRASSEIERQVHDFAPSVSQDTENWEMPLSQSPIVKILDLIIEQAIRDRASDVHIEPQLKRVRVRYRVDGILHDAMSLPSAALEPLVSRIKILGGMNITERRRPQGGQFSFASNDREVDIRASTIETAFGETVVMRILDKSIPLFTLSELGFLPENLEAYREMLERPSGMILVSGPTGSGKTTTLYASISQLDRIGKNIMTIEDPIEYLFENIKQIQVNEKSGITFANGLRAMMRLDPDIILVGEIRDSETANIAIQAALTGHLVLSSIHATSATGVPVRLIDLGVDPYLISMVLIGTVAQRMARVVCHHCRTEYDLTAAELKAYQRVMGEEETTFYHGSGCNFCVNTGYLGRTGIFELLLLSEDMRQMIVSGASLAAIKAQGRREGVRTLEQDGMMKVKEGITTPQEVMRHALSTA